MRWMITGSNRGIGLEYVRQLLVRGETVVAACRTPDKASELQALKQQYDDTLLIIGLDVTDSDSITKAYETVSEQLEGLDVLVNNAAINSGEDALLTVTKEDMMRTFEVNTVGVLSVTQTFLALLQKGDNPRLVNISSGAGSIGDGAPPMYISYSISKTALNMLNMMIHQATHEDGIISIVLNPGWVITDMGGENADLQPEASVKMQLDVIDKLTSDDSGHFKDYTGDEIVW